MASMKNIVPMVIYVGVVATGFIFFGRYMENNRRMNISYAKQISGDYYLYKKGDKLAYISSKDKKDTWGAEEIKPCIYELATYNKFVLAKSYPVSFDFPVDKLSNGILIEFYNQIKVDSSRTFYSLYSFETDSTKTYPEWALFEAELKRLSIPPNMSFKSIKDF